MDLARRRRRVRHFDAAAARHDRIALKEGAHEGRGEVGRNVTVAIVRVSYSSETNQVPVRAQICFNLKITICHIFSNVYTCIIIINKVLIIINKVYSLHWQPKWLNSTIRILWVITNSLMYISNTVYESITIYESVTN